MDPMDRAPEDLNNRIHTAGSGAGQCTPEGPGFGGDGLLSGPAPTDGDPTDGDPSDGDPPAPDDTRAPRPAPAVRLVAGDFLLTVNPVDGCEIEPCPPGRRPGHPVKYTPQERVERARTARPPLPPGLAPHRPPLAERQEERARLVGLLSRGRSVRLTGPGGSGRTTLLDAVAEDCARLAPDGVIRLSGYRRTVRDLLHDLFAAVYRAELHRPDDALLRELAAEIGAVVVLDDLEFGGSALEEFLDATPECAFLISASPDAPAPSADSHLEESFLRGLGRDGGMELLRRTVGRDLTEEEAVWAGDLWFESEGLPVRFVQAGALLLRRDQLRAEAGQAAPRDPLTDGGPAPEVPLPSLAEGFAPVALLASLLSASARTTLRFAVALGGEIPHRAQLPALLGDPQADAALAELLASGLVTPVGARYRLANGVQAQLEAVGFADDAVQRARLAGEHYVWWAGHRSVAPERVLAESDAILATLAALVQHTTEPPGAAGERSLAVHLARTAAPAFAAGLDWSVWERALRSGQEAARRAGEVAEEAYFHHELGVLAVCTGRFDRARAELEASIGLRGALADKRGTLAGRRALALVSDRAAASAPPPGAQAAAAGDRRPALHKDEPGVSGDTPPQGMQTSFGAGVPFLGPEDPETAELPLSPGEPDATTGLPGVARPRAGEPPLPGRPFGASERSAPGEWPVPSRAAEGHPRPGRPTTLSRAPGPLDEVLARQDHRRAASKKTRRNLVAAAGGAVLVAVLGTVVTLGTTSDNGKSGKANPDPTMSRDDGIPADEPAQQSGHSPGPSASRSSGASGATDSESPKATESGGTSVAGSSNGPAPATSEPKSRPASHQPTHRPTTKPPTPTPPSSKPPASGSPSPSPSGSLSQGPGFPDFSDSASQPAPSRTPAADPTSMTPNHAYDTSYGYGTGTMA